MNKDETDIALTQYILFCPLHEPSLLEMLPIAQRIAADGKYKPLFFVDNQQYPLSKEHLDLLHQLDLPIIAPGQILPLVSRSNFMESPIATSSHHSNTGLLAVTYYKLKRLVNRFAPHLVQIYQNGVDYTGKISQAKQLLKPEHIAALIVMADRHIGWETILIKIANRQNIPSLIVPCSLSTPQGGAKLRQEQPEVDRRYGMKSLLNRIIAFFFPKWVYKINGQRLLFYPAAQSLTAWMLGVMPDNPWTLGGGAATQMAVESEYLYHLFIDQGVPASKIVITGKPSMDQMYQADQPDHKKVIKKALSIPETKFVLLCALPHLAEHGLVSWSKHWAEIEFLLATFAGLNNVSIILSLHPKSKPANYEDLAQKYGAIIAQQRIYELLPMCDIFVASFSSTVMQAVGLSKPTVVIDLYNLGYVIFDEVPGVIMVRSHEQLSGVLTKLLSDNQHYQCLAQAQRQQASKWVLMDGRCTTRVVERAYDLIEDTLNS